MDAGLSGFRRSAVKKGRPLSPNLGHVGNAPIVVIPGHLAGVEAKLKAGGKVVDIGCGHGSSTVLMAQAYPNSTIHGIDLHAPSIEEAKTKAAAAGVTNVEFQVAKAQDFAGEGFDFACIFDALHDMGDPVGAARHIRYQQYRSAPSAHATCG